MTVADNIEPSAQKWYILQVHSGHEERVKTILLERITKELSLIHI